MNTRKTKRKPADLVPDYMQTDQERAATELVQAAKDVAPNFKIDKCDGKSLDIRIDHPDPGSGMDLWGNVAAMRRKIILCGSHCEV